MDVTMPPPANLEVTTAVSERLPQKHVPAFLLCSENRKEGSFQLSSSQVCCSLLLPSLPVLPASHVLERPGRRVRCHQPIGNSLVDQRGVGCHRTQQHREASVQHMSYAARQRGGSFKFGGNSVKTK